MEDFPPNLDDGEMWLPSDIFLSDVAAPPGANFNFNTANCFSPPDQLSRRLSALSPDHRQPPRLPLPPKGWTPPCQDSSVSESPLYVRRVVPRPAVCSSYVRRNGSSHTCSSQCHLLRQAESQVNGCMVSNGGGRFLQRPFQNLLLPINYQTRVRTLSVGGTGVFLPRVLQTSPSTSPPPLELRMKQGPRKETNIDKTQKLNVIRRVDACKKVGLEMELPHDWTY